VAELALMKSDLVGIFLTYQPIPFYRTEILPSNEIIFIKGTKHVLYAGVRLGSYPGTAVAIPALLIMAFLSMID
jgi:hypothetical protein